MPGIRSAAPGHFYDAPAARKPEPFAWRRGARWRVWSSTDASVPGGRPVKPDLQDAVILAALLKREGEEAAA